MPFCGAHAGFILENVSSYDDTLIQTIQRSRYYNEQPDSPGTTSPHFFHSSSLLSIFISMCGLLESRSVISTPEQFSDDSATTQRSMATAWWYLRHGETWAQLKLLRIGRYSLGYMVQLDCIS
jgi:hypothetical protein